MRSPSPAQFATHQLVRSFVPGNQIVLTSTSSVLEDSVSCLMPMHSQAHQKIPCLGLPLVPGCVVSRSYQHEVLQVYITNVLCVVFQTATYDLQDGSSLTLFLQLMDPPLNQPHHRWTARWDTSSSFFLFNLLSKLISTKRSFANAERIASSFSTRLWRWQVGSASYSARMH